MDPLRLRNDFTLTRTKIQRRRHDFPGCVLTELLMVVVVGAGGLGVWGAWSTQHHQADRLGVKSQLLLLLLLLLVWGS